MTAVASALVGRGHRVRLASHRAFRSLVREADARIDFFPLHGDPADLVAFMRTCYGHSALRLAATMLDELPRYAAMMLRIFESCWDAFTAPFASHGPFQAIISNPATYAHFHIAEKTGLPLHIFFSQPWVRTKAFPHPLAGSTGDPCWSIQNLLTYDLIESSIFAGLRKEVNYFRTQVLGLEPLSAFCQPWDLLNTCEVPFTGLFSPTLIPKPKDWPKHCSVAGACLISEKLPRELLPPFNDVTLNEMPWLYIGFGSMLMTLNELRLLMSWIASLISDTNLRVLFQLTDTELLNEISPIMNSVAKHYLIVEKLDDWNMVGADIKLVILTFFIPHEVLFKKCAAVIHHGGSGTTHISLAAGVPTMIIPFFADQFSLGNIVQRLGCGPIPLPLCKHSATSFRAGVSVLLQSRCRTAAVGVSRLLLHEDGIETAVRSWEQHLPIHKMVCIAGLIDGAIEHRRFPSACSIAECVVCRSLADYRNTCNESLLVDWKRQREKNLRSMTVMTTSSVTLEMAKEASLTFYLPTRNAINFWLCSLPEDNIPFALSSIGILFKLPRTILMNRLPLQKSFEENPQLKDPDEMSSSRTNLSSNSSTDDDGLPSAHLYVNASLSRYIDDSYSSQIDNLRGKCRFHIEWTGESEEHIKVLGLLELFSRFSDEQNVLTSGNFCKLLKTLNDDPIIEKEKCDDYFQMLKALRCNSGEGLTAFSLIASLYDNL